MATAGVHSLIFTSDTRGAFGSVANNLHPPAWTREPTCKSRTADETADRSGMHEKRRREEIRMGTPPAFSTENADASAVSWGLLPRACPSWCR